MTHAPSKKFTFEQVKFLNREENFWWILLAAVALVVRIGYVLFVGNQGKVLGDEYTYEQLALNIWRYGEFSFIQGVPTVFRPPLYPAIIAGTFMVTGQSLFAVRLLQALSISLSAVILAKIGRMISGSVLVGFLAGLVFIINPLLVFTTSVLYSETLYLLLLLSFSYLFLKTASPEVNWIGYAIGSGFLLGLSVLMKPNLLLFPICLLFWGWIIFESGVKTVKVIGLIALTMAFVVLPWTIRNFLVTGAIVPVSANSGLNLYQGNNPQADGSAFPFDEVDPLTNLSELERDRTYREWGLEWIRSHPLEYVKLIPHKLYKFFSPLETGNRGRVETVLAPLIYGGYGLFYTLALVGFVVSWRAWREWLLVYMLIVYPIILAAIFYGATRYGLIIHPFLGLLAALSVVLIISRIPKVHGKLGPTA